MLRYLFRRTLGGLVILVLISAIAFALFYAVPHDPALLSCGKNCTPDAIKQIHKNLGIDEPIYMQYWHYMVGIFAGRHFLAGNCPAPCLGYSFVQQQPVWDIIKSRFPITFTLAIGGAIVFFFVGTGLGMLAAWRKGKIVDKLASSASLILSSFQIYFIGPIVLAIVVYGLHLLDNPKYTPFTEDPLKWFTGMIIPWLVLSVIFTASYTRMTRSLMVEQLQEEHVKMARAKGMGAGTVFFRYAWRGAIAVILTQFGMDFGSTLGGAIITESTFALPGLGLFSVQSVLTSDLPAIVGIMLFAATLIILFNIIVDSLYAAIDPRVRLS